jgi:hypothetical protein
MDSGAGGSWEYNPEVREAAEILSDNELYLHPFEEGVQIGIDRAGNTGLEIPMDSLVNVRSTLAEALATWPEELSERFVTLFVENITVASIARFAYGDFPLKVEDIRGFLGHSAAIFNSFRHMHE